MDLFLKNGIGDRHFPPHGSGLPNHLLNIIGPFANALTGSSSSPLLRPPGNIPSSNLLDSFQPPEKRLRR